MLAIPIEQRNLFLEEGRRRAARIALALTPPINDAGIKAPQSRAKILLLLYSAMDTAPDILAVIYRAVDSMNAELPPDRQLARLPAFSKPAHRYRTGGCGHDERDPHVG